MVTLKVIHLFNYIIKSRLSIKLKEMTKVYIEPVAYHGKTWRRTVTVY